MVGLQVVSLTEKLQAQEVVMDQQTLPPPENIDGGVHTGIKTKDGQSSGSGGSAVVDEDSPQLIDSGNSYFPDDYPSCMGPIDGLQSEEDVGDNSKSYFSGVFAAAEQPQQVGDEPLGWWVWP